MSPKAEKVMSLYLYRGEDLQENAHLYGLSLRDVQDINASLWAFSLTTAKIRSSV